MHLQRANNIFVSSSFFIFITRFFPSLANLLVLVWYSRQLPEDVNGNYLIFWTQLYVIYPFMCLGIHSLVQTYSRNLLANLLSKLTKKHYALYSAWLVLVSCVFAWLQNDTGNVRFLTSALFILSFSAGVITESLLIVLRKFRVLSVTGFVYALLFAGIHLWVLDGNFSVQTVFSCLLVLNMLKVFVHSCAILLEIRKDKDGYEAEDVDMHAVKLLWVHLGLYDIVQVLSTWVDKFIIALVLTSGVSAIYYYGAQNIPFLPLLLSAAGSAILLQMSDVFGKNRRETTLALLNRSGRLLSSIVFPVFCFLFFFREELFVNVFSEKYIPSIPIFAASILVLPVRAYSFTTVLQQEHKGNIINIGAVGELLLACLLIYPLYNIFGLPGVALSFVVSTYAQAIFYLIQTSKVLGTPITSLIPLINWLSKLIIFSLLFIAIHYSASIYFAGRFTLILGAAAMVVTGGLSLLVELTLDKKHGRITEQSPFKEYR